MRLSPKPKTRRGAVHNPNNRFDQHQQTIVAELMDRPGADWEAFPQYSEDEVAKTDRTKYLPTYPKTILNRITSPDIRGEWGLNPYQGCEHGCAYCFARNTHNYWGYSAGQDFERVILIKRNTVSLLDEALSKPSWKASAIMVSGNTDCYQPVERKERLTRGVLELCNRYKHPIGIITKNSMIQRDLELVAELAQDHLIHVAISITTLDESLRRVLEPRTATIKQRLDTIAKLTAVGVPVRVMIAPIIPGLTDHEVMPIAKAAIDAGAKAIGYTVARLNGDVAEIFAAWAHQHVPDRAERILNQISACHGGKLNDSRWGTRQRGEGAFAESIAQRIKIARAKYLNVNSKEEERRSLPAYNTQLFEQFRPGQHKLF